MGLSVDDLVEEYVENADEVIDQLIAHTSDSQLQADLEAIKSWPDAAKGRWVLQSDTEAEATTPSVQAFSGGAAEGALCLVVVTALVTVAYYVWEWITTTDEDGNSTKERIRERRERIEEVEKLVHGSKHKGGECPDG